MPRLHSLRARLALNRGEIDEAMRHVRAQGDLAQITTTLFQNEVPPLTAARVYVAAGGSANLAQARTLLNTLNTYVRTMHHTQWAADAYLVQAQLHAKEERENEALAALRQALELCEREDAPRTLFEQGATLQPQLRYLLGRGVSVGLITRVLEATPGSTSTRSTSVGGLVEPLTNREMDVLDLLVDRLTNKEIATLLGVSTATIQTHLNNLYQKLGAENRRDAVMRARNLKILA
jgi:LuxR family maltose regulon positive regulatory protein